MVNIRVISQSEGDEMHTDWNAHKKDEDSVFISPTITVIAGESKDSKYIYAINYIQVQQS